MDIETALKNAGPEEREAIIKQLQEMALNSKYDKDDFLNQQEPHMRVRFEALHENQDKLDELHKALAEERRVLELKYRGLCEPHFVERSKIVTGAVVPAGGEGEEKGIPAFWLACLSNCDVIEEHVTEKDAKVLEHLIDLTCEFIEPEAGAADKDGADEDGDEDAAAPHYGFLLRFVFEENEFFEHKELTKSYLFSDADQTVLIDTEGFDIMWKSGKNPTVKVLKKAGKKGGAAKFKTEAVASFFDFFKPPAIPDGDEDEMDEQEEEALQEAVEDDYEIGDAIREKVIPQALKWYTGEAAMEEGVTMGGMGDDEDDDDEDDDDDDDDGDAPVAPPADKQAECKQQ